MALISLTSSGQTYFLFIKEEYNCNKEIDIFEKKNQFSQSLNAFDIEQAYKW